MSTPSTWLSHRSSVAVETPSNGTTPRSLRLEDGSSIVLATSENSIRIRNQRLPPVGIEVVKGAARFDVTHDPARVFRVLAAGVTVEVIGTSFTVELYSSGTRVAVDRGRVRVRWNDKSRILSAGEAGVFGELAPAGSRGSMSFRTTTPRTEALPALFFWNRAARVTG